MNGRPRARHLKWVGVVSNNTTRTYRDMVEVGIALDGRTMARWFTRRLQVWRACHQGQPPRRRWVMIWEIQPSFTPCNDWQTSHRIMQYNHQYMMMYFKTRSECFGSAHSRKNLFRIAITKFRELRVLTWLDAEWTKQETLNKGALFISTLATKLNEGYCIWKVKF